MTKWIKAILISIGIFVGIMIHPALFAISPISLAVLMSLEMIIGLTIVVYCMREDF